MRISYYSKSYAALTLRDMFSVYGKATFGMRFWDDRRYKVFVITGTMGDIDEIYGRVGDLQFVVRINAYKNEFVDLRMLDLSEYFRKTW